MKETLEGHFIECLTEVEKKDIQLTMHVKGLCPVIYCLDELCFARQLLPKTMLIVNDDVLTTKVFSKVAENYVLLNLTANTG